MIETAIPEIDVTQLIERVREEAARIELKREVRPAAPAGPAIFSLPKITPPPPAPSITPAVKKTKADRATLDGLLQRGRDKNDRPGVPRFLRGLFRKQGGYNRVLLQLVDVLARHLARLNQQTGETARYEHEIRTWAMRANEELITLGQAQNSLAAELSKQRLLGSELNAAGEHLRNLQAEVDRLGLCVSNLQQERATAEERATTEERLRAGAAEHLRNLQAEVDRVGLCLSNLQQERATTEERLRTGTAEHLRNLQAEVDRLGLCVSNLEQESSLGAERLRSLTQRITDHADQKHTLQQTVSQLDERITSDGAYIKAELSQQGQTLRRLAEAGIHTSAKRKQRQASAPDHSLDAFYLSFENRFRGPRGEIKKRLAPYLSYILDARAGIDDRPILDVGCGRGEWLELLKDQSLQGRGVDVNSAMVGQCHERHLEVVEADVIDYLRSHSDNSLGAVTGFHIIEHLPLQTLFGLVAESYRTLRPGGVVIFESPNCKNLVVGACNFNIDPTHRNPIFPETAEFMLKLAGFDRVELKYSSPVETAGFPGRTPQARVLNDLLYGPQDFGVIAYKPSAI